MAYYAVECEAPSGGYGPNAILVYDRLTQYIDRVDYLDIIFDVWLGGELIQDVSCFCVTQSLWNYLVAKGIGGVDAREMSVTYGEHLNDWQPDRVIPSFKELVLQRSVKGNPQQFEIEFASIPVADMCTGTGFPLIVNDKAKSLLDAYGVTGLEYQQLLII